jgi:hypothetical protein
LDAWLALLLAAAPNLQELNIPGFDSQAFDKHSFLPDGLGGLVPNLQVLTLRHFSNMCSVRRLLSGPFPNLTTLQILSDAKAVARLDGCTGELFQGSCRDVEVAKSAKIKGYGAARSTTGPKLAAAMAAGPTIADSDEPEPAARARFQQQAVSSFSHMVHDEDCSDLRDFVAPKLRLFDGRMITFSVPSRNEDSAVRFSDSYIPFDVVRESRPPCFILSALWAIFDSR